ncbi:MAG TPA: O-antigen ligase family protein [Bacteroidales bacterium]|nr:O-antigen ligase family protein [Bacteroidales bacterium]
MKEQPRKKRPVTTRPVAGPAPSALKKVKKQAPELSLGIIILAYALITVITPNLYTFDSNGPKFLALAVLNIVTFLFLLTRKDLGNRKEVFFLFFRNGIGLVYLGMMLLALLSFMKSINILESVLHYSKMLTIFSACYFISIILRHDLRYLKLVAVALSLLLVFDCLTLFYHIANSLIAGKGPAIVEIKSVYSNKNILAAAIFVKIPFALWLLTFEKGVVRVLGLITLFLAFIATLFMSTRAFYVGSIVILLFYLVFTGIRYYRKNSLKRFFTVTLSVVLAIVIGLSLYSATLKFLYPKDYHDLYTVGFLARLKTVAQGESLRAGSWDRSVRLIGENPLLGVGCGNWKVAVLKYENPEKPDYVYQYKTHNDFLEIACESGIITALLFISIFVFAALRFLKVFFRKGSTEADYHYLFLPAFGLLAYAFDAFFNFPADRPEIGSLFALFAGAVVAVSPGLAVFEKPVPDGSAGETTTGLKNLSIKMGSLAPLIATLFLLLMVTAVVILSINFRSLKIQRIAKEDLMRPEIMEPTDKIVNGYPFIPNLSMEAEPIVVSKARYLFRDKKYQEAIDLLKADRSSPYDTRPEFFLAQAYFNLGAYDSALACNYRVYTYKPLFFNNILNICRILEMKNRYDEAIGLVRTYNRQAPYAADGYLFGAALCQNGGRTGDAAAILDSGHKYLPENEEILKQKEFLAVKTKIGPHEALYNSAQKAYIDKNYRVALKEFDDFIKLVPDLVPAREMRAYCNFFLKDYNRSLSDVAWIFNEAEPNGAMYNLRGVNLHMLGKDEEACRDFEQAVKMGDKDAVTNLEQFCKKK